MQTFKSTRSGRFGTALALAGTAALLPLTAAAADETAPQPTGTSSQMVVRDAATGRLRAPTAEEAQALQPSRGARRTAAQPLLRQHVNGARGARLTEDFMSYSVVVRQPDGRLVEQCFESKEAADAAVKHGAAVATTTASPLPTE